MLCQGCTQTLWASKPNVRQDRSHCYSCLCLFFNCITCGSWFTEPISPLHCCVYHLAWRCHFWKAKEKAYLENRLLKHSYLWRFLQWKYHLSSYAVISRSSWGQCSGQCNMITLSLGAGQYILFEKWLYIDDWKGKLDKLQWK